MSVGYQDNFKVGSPKPIDSRFGYNDLTNGTYRLYNSPGEVTGINGILPTFRYQGLTVGINNSGKTEEWWFRDGILDTHLIKKTSGAGGDVENGLSINPANSKIRLGGDLNQVTTIGTSSTNTLSITGLEASSSNVYSITLDANGRLYKSDYVSAILAENGLTKTGNKIILGGSLTQDTTITLASKVLSFTATATGDNASKIETNKTLRKVSNATSDITGVKLKSTFDLNGASLIDFNTDCKINTSNYNLLEFSVTDASQISGAVNQGLFSASHNELILGGTFASQNKVNGNVSALSTRVVFKQNVGVDTLAAHRIMSPIISGTYTGATTDTVGLQIDSQRFHLNTTQVAYQYAIRQSGTLDLNQFQGRTSFTNNVAIGLSATSITDINNSDISINNIPLTVIKGVSDLTVAPLMASTNSILVINNVSDTAYQPGLVSSVLGQLNYSSSSARDLTGRSNFSATGGYFVFNSNTVTTNGIPPTVGQITGGSISGIYGRALFSGKEITVANVNSTTTAGEVTLLFPTGITMNQFAAGDLVRLQPGSPGTGGTFTDVDIQISAVNISTRVVTLKKNSNISTNITALTGGDFIGKTIIVTKAGGSLDKFVAVRAATPVPSSYLGFKGTLTTAIGLQIDDQQNGVGSSILGSEATKRPTGTLTESYGILQLGVNDKNYFKSNRNIFVNLPTSASGLPSGCLWRDSANGNVVKVVP